jgi:hypothetical protein
MLLTALLLVALPMSAFAVASTQREMPLPVTAAMHRHYYEVGKRQCGAAIKKAEAQAPEGEVLGFGFAIGAGGIPRSSAAMSPRGARRRRPNWTPPTCSVAVPARMRRGLWTT